MAPSAFFSGRNVVRWGIIGCGDVTEVKSGPGFRKASGSQLVAVMRRDAAKAEDYAKRHGVPRWYSDADALIADREVDAVYIATPPESHADYALKVAAAGKPAYVEKPMARSAAECDVMVDAFARAKLPLYVAYYRRRLPRFLKAEDLVKTGAVGRVTGVSWRFAAPQHRSPDSWRVEAKLAGGGHFLDLASHALDYIDYLLGPLSSVTGAAANLASPYAVEDAVTLAFRTQGGVPGVAACNFASAVRDDTLRITGTEGEISFSVFGTDAVRFESAAGVQNFELPNPPHVAQPLIQTVVDDLLGLDSCPSTGESARRTSRVMDAALTDYYGGRGDAFWTRAKTWPGRRQS
ncbi:MAG TPA: Gfo/Idh/MocA family oxidoreductase [Opitutaceae bacterium]|nr:Gfo/Idh/MocA family oxidoreductase [Opitutaceae bacterium]